MKKLLLTVLALTLLLSATVLPSGAVPIPQNAMIATAREQIAATVGTDTAGAAVALFENGERLMLEGFGYADLSQKTLITPETVFEIGELSGLFVALAAYRLAETSKFSLDDSITHYLTTDFAAALKLRHPVTVEHLLLGTAGFEGRTFDLIFDEDAYRFDSLEKALRAQIPAQIAQPGSFYADSPFGIALAAYVIECASGLSYADYVTEQVLRPLGLGNTVLEATATSLPHDHAVGHLKRQNGVFSAAAEGGRSYAGLYPATGALSSVRDLSALMDFLLCGKPDFLSEASRMELLQSRYATGVFRLSAPAMSVRGTAMGRDGDTLCFGASFWLDSAGGTGAIVLTNTASSALLHLPATLCGATRGAVVPESTALTDPNLLRGYFAHVESESSSFVGRLLRKDSNGQVEVNEDGTVSFLGMRLVQIAPGLFADANGDPTVAVVQFLTDTDGTPTQIVTADGDTYLPVKLWEYRPVSTLLLGLFAFLSLFFVAWGILALIRYLTSRYEKNAPGIVYVIPQLFAALAGLCCFIQLLVGVRFGPFAFCSFFGAMSVITLLLCVCATICYVLAFAAALTRKGMTPRVVRSSVLFLGYLAVLVYWGIISF